MPTINDFLSRLYVIRDTAREAVRGEARALIAANAAKGLRASGATLKGLASLVETALESGLAETLEVLRHMQLVPDVDSAACRDQALVRMRELAAVLRGAAGIDGLLDEIGSGDAASAIEQRMARLYERIAFRFRQYDVGLDKVALSFAGEQRDYVREVAKALSARHIAVFYDEFEANSLWGTDGAEHFHRIYSSATQYVVMFISQAYVTKAWTRQERRAAISRQIKSESEYILPVRFDYTEVPGIPDTMQYLMANRFTPAQLAVEIAKKVGVVPTTGKASHVPPPFSSALSGEVTFDYGAYNGSYVIGSGTSSFETAWSKASDSAIHLYNDPSGIHGIALARGAAAIDQIEDASAYDFTSRSRTVKVGEIAVLQNIDGFYAAVEIVHIDDDSRGAPSDSLTIRYAVLPTGETNFAARGGAAPRLMP